jgi:hypothetical protein
MAKLPTPETIAETLTPRERLALLEIRDRNQFNWEGAGEDAANLIYETDALGRLIGFTVEEDEFIGHNALGRSSPISAKASS